MLQESEVIPPSGKPLESGAAGPRPNSRIPGRLRADSSKYRDSGKHARLPAQRGPVQQLRQAELPGRCGCGEYPRHRHVALHGRDQRPGLGIGSGDIKREHFARRGCTLGDCQVHLHTRHLERQATARLDAGALRVVDLLTGTRSRAMQRALQSAPFALKKPRSDLFDQIRQQHRQLAMV